MKKSKIRKAKMSPLPEKLAALIKNEPALLVKLAEALEADRFFITVTFQKKYQPADKNDLHHHYCQKNIPDIDCLNSINFIANDFKAKKMPTAEIQDDGQWH